MALQAIANISVDFYDKKYILINAKQYDKKSRFLSVTCYSHGELCPLNSAEHSAYVRYKKSDGHSVFNFCEINAKGKILVELTEQMLASVGTCYADLVVVNRGNAVVDKNTGEIIEIIDSGILSTMPFYIDVFETTVENSEIESSYDYDGLNDLIERAETEYSEVVRVAKSYAVGGTGERENENTDNAKYYYEQSKRNASNAETYMNTASNSVNIVKGYTTDALTYSQNSQTYMGQAKTYMDNAKTSESNAKTSENNAKTSESKAFDSEQDAQQYANNALEYQNTAYNYSVVAQRYAVGGTNTVTDEDIDNAKYYYEQVRNIAIGASVIGVKGNNESDYRTGNVNITPENVGAIPSADIATVDEVKELLGII